MSNDKNPATIIPTMRYRDAAAAIDWLCDTLGFERRLVVPGENDTIVHAQLTLGNGMIMLSSAFDDEYGALVRPLENDSSPCTQSPYIVVNDIDSLYETVKASGARIEMPLKEEDYGGKIFSCRDPQGQLWNFGSYNPWASN